MSKTTDRLSHVEEIELIRILQDENSKPHQIKRAKDKLVLANLGLVHKIVNNFPIRNVTCSYDDLFQEGVGGLIHGIELFEPTKGCRLSTYVYRWISAGVQRAFQNAGRTIRVPVHQSSKQLQLNRVIETLSREFGRAPTSAEVAQVMPDSDLVLSTFAPVQSLNQLVAEESELDCLVGEDDSSLDAKFDVDILLDKAGDLLSERDRLILKLRFGLEGQTPQTLTEVSERVGVTRARCHQIEKAALAKLREVATITTVNV